MVLMLAYSAIVDSAFKCLTLFFFSWPSPARCVFRVPSVQREDTGLCWLQRKDTRPFHAAGTGQVLARRLSKMCVLWLPPGPDGLHPLHPGQPHSLPTGLPEVPMTFIQMYGGTGGLQGKGQLDFKVWSSEFSKSWLKLIKGAAAVSASH